MFTKEGHILAIAIPFGENIITKDAKDAIKGAKDLGAILSAVHPFYFKGIGNFLIANNNLISQFSSWEVYNGSTEFSFPGILPRGLNKQSLQFYESLLSEFSRELGISSATDGHSVGVIGKCYTELSLEDNFMWRNFVGKLDRALRQVKSLYQLHMEPNRVDAGIHAVKMGLVKLQGKR